MTTTAATRRAAILLISGLAFCAAPSRAPAAPEIASPADPERIAKAQAAFAIDIIGRLAEAGPRGGNVLVSPAGVAAVFALLDVGADAPMRAAMSQVLGFGPATARADLAALRAALNRGGAGPLIAADALVFDPSAKPLAAAVSSLRAAGAEVSEMDLSEPASRDRINAWVSGKTGGLIPILLAQPLRETAFVALNALHFKDRWQLPFSPERTRPAPFRGADGREVSVPMMSLSGTLRGRSDDRFIAVDLPYQDPAFSLVVVTTAERPEPAPAFQGAAAWLSGEGFEDITGELMLPRFEAEGVADLLPGLDGLGLQEGRTSPTALAGLMEGRHPISRILQRSVLKVDEQGSEAAAATAVVASRAIKVGAFRMLVDRPFLFALRDRPSGALLLAGYVSAPRLAAPTDTAETQAGKP